MTLPTPTIAQAVDYVRAYFAKHSQTVTICGSVTPAQDSSGPLVGTRAVLFIDDTGSTPNRIAVWFERVIDGEHYLYGQW